MSKRECEVGVIGLGNKGKNLLVNMVTRGHWAAAYDRDPATRKRLQAAYRGRNVRVAGTLQDFVGLLPAPRIVMIIVSSGPPVEEVISDLVPHLEPGDILIDCGDSYFKDTNQRGMELAKQGIILLGVGLSGETDDGPSIMVGGSQAAHKRVRPIFESIAGRAGGEPCIAYLGLGSAGHYVKMVQNAIAHALMQLNAEIYRLITQCLCLARDELYALYEGWNQTELNGFLVGIAPRIFRSLDENTSRPLIDAFLGEARQNEMGKWAIQDAMDLQVPVPTLQVALALRRVIEHRYRPKSHRGVIRKSRFPLLRQPKIFLDHLRHALYAGMIITYSQGITLIQAASRVYHYDLNVENVVAVWRGGSIIRAALLERIRFAYGANPGLKNPLLDPHLAQELMTRQANLRSIVRTAVELGIPVPCLMVSLAFFDSHRSSWLPANLIQAQWDYFDSERVPSCMQKKGRAEQVTDRII